MPDARGNFKGQGWSKGREEGWERVFGDLAQWNARIDAMCEDCDMPDMCAPYGCAKGRELPGV